MSPGKVGRGESDGRVSLSGATAPPPVQGCTRMPRIVPVEPAPPRGGWFGWYGADPSWVIPLEASARRALGRDLTAHLGLGVLTYNTHQVSVPGDRQLHDITIRFYAEPRYPTYGLAPEEYPQVQGGSALDSPHRMPDESLCLWQPHDPIARRWVPGDGLLALIKHACNHLFLEDWYRDHHEWLIAQAPHALPAKDAM